MKLCSYEWQTNEEFLIARLFPDRTCLSARPGEGASEVLSRLPADSTHFVFQINCTETALFVSTRQALLSGLLERGIRVINSATTDISKRTLQRVCLEHGLNSTLASKTGNPDETLIVKTDLNYGGHTERHALNGAERQKLQIADPSELVSSVFPGFIDYPVLKRREIPDQWWHDSQIVIEHFIENVSERFYRLHVFLGRISITEAICPGPVKKLGPKVVRKSTTYYSQRQLEDGAGSEAECRIINQVLSLQEHMGFEFAGVDVVVDNEWTPFVIDVNPTPFAGPTSPGSPMIAFLREAINDEIDGESGRCRRGGNDA